MSTWEMIMSFEYVGLLKVAVLSCSKILPHSA
jgi:hypothetical protein